MTVWILISSNPDLEDFGVYGVFSSKEKAEQALPKVPWREQRWTAPVEYELDKEPESQEAPAV